MTVGTLDYGDFFILVPLIALPIAAIAFILGAGDALRQIGKGPWAIEQELPRGTSAAPAPVSRQTREAEIRQMLEARSYRRQARGGEAIDVDAELESLLAAERTAAAPRADRGLREEVRQLVVARNERRMRRGQEPVDVDAEVDRQLRELEHLDQ